MSGTDMSVRSFQPVMDVTEQTFQAEVVDRSADAPVVVDFWADWCGPCKVLAPVLEEAVAARDDLVLAKVDVEANPNLANEYGIRGIPAVKAFRNGHVVAEFVGAQSRASVDAFLDELTKPASRRRSTTRRSPTRSARTTTSERWRSSSRASRTAPTPSSATRSAA
jgi:thioredoxin